MTDSTNGLPTPSDPTPQNAGSNPPSARPLPPKPVQQLSREQILDATATCLKELGYEKTTIRKIAATLDCAVGSIYRYFKDKRDLLSSVTQRRFEPVAEAIADGAAVDQTMQDYVKLAETEPEQYRLMFWMTSVGKQTQAVLPAVIARIIDGWTHQLGNRREAELRWSAVHGAVMLGRQLDAALTGSAEAVAVEPVVTQTPPGTTIPSPDTIPTPHGGFGTEHG